LGATSTPFLGATSTPLLGAAPTPFLGAAPTPLEKSSLVIAPVLLGLSSTLGVEESNLLQESSDLRAGSRSHHYNVFSFSATELRGTVLFAG